MSGVDQPAREAATAAERLLNDRFLQEALDEMIQMATEAAITGDTRDARRDGRYLALAILKLRGNLQAVVDHVRSAAGTERAAKAHE